MAKGNFIRIDELILANPKIQKLIISRGYEALGFYIALLTTMRAYASTAYRIPLDDLEIIASWQLKLNDEQLSSFAEFIEKAVELDILQRNEEYIWSDRRVNDLMAQELIREKQKDSAIKTNIKRFGIA